MSANGLEKVAQMVNLNLPENFINFMINNGGLSHYERIFRKPDGNIQEVQQYLTYPNINKMSNYITEELGFPVMVFANDPGGWHYALKQDADGLGVYVIKSPDYEEDRVEKLALSFEAFIDALERKD